jgi:hypothetical protein
MCFAQKRLLIILLISSIISGCTFNCAVTTTVNDERNPKLSVSCGAKEKTRGPIFY